LLTQNLLISRTLLIHRKLVRITRSGLPLFAALFLAGTAGLEADTISSNLSETSAGTETASGSTWLTASFGTGSSSAALEAVTLLLSNSTSGAAEVDLYSDGLLAPGSPIAQLTSPATYSTALTDTSFSASGITLAANTTYWIVLKASAGAFDWSWTDDNTGTGIGYQGTWGTSSNAGGTWFTYTAFPTQFSVTTSDSTVATAPEPDTWMLSAAGFLVGGGVLRKRIQRAGKGKDNNDEK
jgi:hypothetical protein